MPYPLRIASPAPVTTIPLLDGHAEVMGDGLFIVLQVEAELVQSVVLTEQDLRAMLLAA